MAKIVGIGKYPPLEGGISAKTYWFANAMAERGHTIHSVADQLGVDEVHSIARVDTLPCHSNVIVHRPDEVIPWHIPDDRHRTLCLLNKLIEVIEIVKPDLIEANYLVPYGLIAYLASQITGIPYVLRHGGSDIRKFLVAGLWPNLWRKALERASLIITDADSKEIVAKWSPRAKCLIPYVPDPRFFQPMHHRKRDRLRLALIGKANFFWKNKGWHRVVDIWQQLGDTCDFVVVTQGNGLEAFKGYAHSRIEDKVSWQKFVPPWEMPGFLNSIDCLFCFEADLPFPVFSNLVLEAICCGRTVFVDTPDVTRRFQAHGIDLNKQTDLIVPLPFQDPARAAEKIAAYYFTKPDSSVSLEPAVYEHYILSNEKALLEAARSRGKISTALTH